MAKYRIIEIISTSIRKYINFLKNYGCLGIFVNIFLIILPLLDPKPTLIAIANVSDFIV